MKKDVKVFVEFLRLAQKNCQNRRSIDFYAEKLQITSEELSRIIWDASDSTLSEWLDVMEQINTGNCNSRVA